MLSFLKSLYNVINKVIVFYLSNRTFLKMSSCFDGFNNYTWIFSYSTVHIEVQLIHQWYSYPSPFVLRLRFSSVLTLTVDRNRTVSRRSEPNSGATLKGEQPYPWNFFLNQDVTNRHRGAKQLRRYLLSGVISLLSLAYLLSVEQ